VRGDDHRGSIACAEECEVFAVRTEFARFIEQGSGSSSPFRIAYDDGGRGQIAGGDPQNREKIVR
jgi:hypothetical protein